MTPGGELLEGGWKGRVGGQIAPQKVCWNLASSGREEGVESVNSQGTLKF